MDIQNIKATSVLTRVRTLVTFKLAELKWSQMFILGAIILLSFVNLFQIFTVYYKIVYGL